MRAPRRDLHAKKKFAERSSPSERSWELMRELVKDALQKQKDVGETQERLTRRLQAIVVIMLACTAFFMAGVVIRLIADIFGR